MRQRPFPCCGAGARWPLATSLALAATLLAAEASAEGPPPLAEAPPLLRYDREPGRDLFRAALEGVGVLTVGYVEYLVSTHQLGRGVAYDGALFYDKLSGNAQSFDANHFGTNFIGHPIGGTMYYTSARSNRLSVAQSFGWAFTGSLLWEYFGEIGEKPSYNDMIATPWGGFANGEMLNQLGVFFGRSRGAARTLGLFFGWPRAAHDAVDGVALLPADEVDGAGLPRDVGHDFRAALFAGAASSNGAAGLHPEAGVDLSLEVENVPVARAPTPRSYSYEEGNLATLRFRLAAGDGRVVDARYDARVSPLGWVDETVQGEAGALRGHRALFGLTVGHEYSVHDYDRSGQRPVDELSRITVLGLRGEVTRYLSTLRLRGRLELDGDFAGVRAFGLPAYVTRHAAASDTTLPLVVRTEGYYFAAGATLAPSLTLTAGPIELHSRLEWTELSAIEGVDVDAKSVTADVPRGDRRVTAQLRLAARGPGPLEVGLEGTARHRSGRVGDTRDRRNERSAAAFLGVRF